MDRLYLDFETYCDLDIRAVGLYKYVSHSSFHPWCVAYAINDEEVELWVNGEDFSPTLRDALDDEETKLYAHNAEFEWNVFRIYY